MFLYRSPFFQKYLTYSLEIFHRQGYPYNKMRPYKNSEFDNYLILLWEAKCLGILILEDKSVGVQQKFYVDRPILYSLDEIVEIDKKFIIHEAIIF